MTVSQYRGGSCRYRFIRRGRIFLMSFLEEDSLFDLTSLQALVTETLPQIDLFMPHSEKYISDILRSKLSVLGISADGSLVAYSIIRFPGIKKDNLGRDLNMKEDDLRKVAHLQAVAVHPQFRGYGLQRELLSAHLPVLKLDDVECEHICSTVSPKNPVSLNNILSCGFVVRALLPKFNGWYRYILYRNVSWPANEERMALPRDVIRISSSDIDGQRDLLNRGYEGYKVEWNSRDSEVFYRRKSANGT